jgi:hypothetical protein
MRLIALVLLLYTSVHPVSDQIELVCLKKQKATNTCHYNFKVNGIDHSFVDAGCHYSREKVIEKVEEGTIALKREWKVKCK